MTQVKSIDLGAGLQIAPRRRQATRRRSSATPAPRPPQNQQCTWVRKVASHPAFEKFTPVEVAAGRG